MPIKRSYADTGDACASAHAMELIGDRWTHPILRELMLAPKRFTELEDSLPGITPAVLTARLRQLTDAALVQRELAPGRVTVYALTPWAQELRPVFESLGRWAHRSPLWHPEGNGLTPDAAVQSMLTMAHGVRPARPLRLELRLRDDRLGPEAVPYTYRLTWDDELTIERGPATDPEAVVTGDSTTWVGVLYHGAPLGTVEVTGDTDAVRLLAATFSPAAAPA